jgi:hypothetical protein
VEESTARRWITMSDKTPEREGIEEAIEDLEAPAAVQEDVAGGACQPPSMYCKKPTCWNTCTNNTMGGCGPKSVIVIQVE